MRNDGEVPEVHGHGRKVAGCNDGSNQDRWTACQACLRWRSCRMSEARPARRRRSVCFLVQGSGGQQEIQPRQTDDESSLLELELVRKVGRTVEVERRGGTR